jgi:adenylate cyclase
VITAIIGKLKSDIVFHGDVLNTSERILNQCHPLQKKILVSEFVVLRLNLYPYFEAEFVNSIRLKGKEKDMSLYTIVETDLF